MDNIGNSHKWGDHNLTEEEFKSAKAPTWINSFGYGENALKKELAGEVGVELDLPEPNGKREPFQWGRLQYALSQVMPLIAPMNLDGHILDFPTAMLVLQKKYERGESYEFLTVTEHLNKLSVAMDEYKAWSS